MAKLTNKERDSHLQWLTNMVNNNGKVFAAYLEFKGESADFQKFLIDFNEKLKKEKENDTETNN
tara:strand:- start:311 stop:502 length:192 start_codon:yes stop_codon:yes gene_type:complete